MADLKVAILTTQSSRIFNTSAFVLAVLSLTETPSFIPLTLLLTNLLLYVQIIHCRASHLLLHASIISLAAAAANSESALHALSTVPMSIITLLGLSGVESLIALSIVFAHIKLSGRLKPSWTKSILFPVLWATTWSIVAHISPIGRLLMWSPVQGLLNYGWISRFVGPSGIDWVVGAYAVIFSEVIGSWLMGPSIEGDGRGTEEIRISELDDNELPRTPRPAKPRRTLTLAAIIALLTLPAYLTNAPLPPSSFDTTPLTVGCALPSSIYDEEHNSSLEDFITTSQSMTQAKVIIWPESAVTFANIADRNAAFEEVHKRIPGTYVGVSFEEFAPVKSGRVGMKRNGFALIAPVGVKGPQVKIEYYKRLLVPIAESFAVAPSPDPPTIYNLELNKPKGPLTKPQWAPAPNFTRPIPLTASICLDFSSPSSFSSLPSRPALILAPGRTWHPAVGRAMWQQAKARAEEMDSMVLWCDGGKGGVSGVAGGGIDEIMHVGEGSWTRTIGLQWPFDEGRTVYARFGDTYILLATWLLVGGVWARESGVLGNLFPAITGGFSGVLSTWRNRRRIARGENTPLLL